MENLRELLGAGPPAGTLQVTLFLPSVDQDGQGIGQAEWREQALRVFGRLFRGATAFPPGRGVWRDDRRGGDLVFDDTVLITSYVDPEVLDDAALRELRCFLHRLGREGRQGEVGVVIGGTYYGITEYDDEAH
ncbi:MAG: hypothetical protein HY906_15800 [Deltaproteobacteria bacterium]|nr:hypothetical protein [Deltaproteobacteria bacterium]